VAAGKHPRSGGKANGSGEPPGRGWSDRVELGVDASRELYGELTTGVPLWICELGGVS
jgi:hypothetical protein